MWTIPPILCSLLTEATLVFLQIYSLWSGLLIMSPSYLPNQVKCRLITLGFKVLCNVTPSPSPALISHSNPRCISLLHMYLISSALLWCFLIPVFQLVLLRLLRMQTPLPPQFCWNWILQNTFKIQLVICNLYFSMKPCSQPNECNYAFLWCPV